MVAFDVVEDILLRSDAKDLLRCKSVCKSWYSLISTSRFVKAHLKIAAAANDSHHSRIAMPTFWKTFKSSTIMYQRNFWIVVGSSNGLVCVSRRFDGLTLVINPWTREVRTLPIAPINPKPRGGFVPLGLSLSFGYDASSDDYKVVMGFNENHENPDEILFQVLSLKSNTWKTIGRFNYSIYLDMSGIMFNGSIYWIVWDPDPPPEGIHYVILSFDLSLENFSIILQPKDSRYFGYTINLGIMENQLCLYYPFDHQETWVMRSHDSWERLPNDCEMTHHVVHFMNMLEFSSSDQNQETINFVCLDNKCLPKPWKIYPHIFFPSLISPFVNSDERPSHPTNSNTFVNKWSIEVAKARKKYFNASKKIVEDYRMEVGGAQNLYLHEDGDETYDLNILFTI